jgi:rhodanese-related sulfurtransferase
MFSTVSATTKYKKLSAVQCDSLIVANFENPNFVILDVRTPGEWNPDHLQGSINRNYYDTDFTAKLSVLPKHKIYLVHCKSGGRSAGAVSKMKNLEFDEIYELSGGINSWKSAGLLTTHEIAPKLMLVKYNETAGQTNIDTVKITVTNRGNDSLRILSAIFNDVHEISTNINTNSALAEAQDYTFSIFHSPEYYGTDTTAITLESNGGKINFNIIFKNGLLQKINEQFLPEWSIFPNPAKNRISIKNTNSFQNIEISIYNLNGQLELRKLLNDVSKSVDISNLSNGIYLVQLKSKHQISTQKLLIQR